MCAVTLNICVSKMCWIYFQMRFKLPSSFTLLKWLTLITLDKDCRLRSFSLWHFLHPTVTSSLINLKYLYILFSNNGDLCSSLNRKRNCNYTSCNSWFVFGRRTRRRKILEQTFVQVVCQCEWLFRQHETGVRTEWRHSDHKTRGDDEFAVHILVLPEGSYSKGQ
jgi:hypothetical protein